MPATLDLVLTPAERRLLQGLSIRPRKAFEGRVRGERLTQRKGLSIEFADYREYAEGDDLRHLDWNVLARLDHPIVKTYRDEEDLAVYLLVDTSSSMGFGDVSKLDSARGLAAMLAFAGLHGGDAIYLGDLDKLERLRPLRGRSNFHRVAGWLGTLDASGDRRLAVAVREFASMQARAGVIALITDGMDPELPAALKLLRGRGHEVWLVQVLSDVELRPDIEGDLRLIDSESGNGVEITANYFTMREYRARLNSHLQALDDECKRIGGRYLLAESGQPLKRTVQTLTREGWLGR